MKSEPTYKMQMHGTTLVRYVNEKHYFVKHRAYAFDVSEMKRHSQWLTLEIRTQSGRVYAISKEVYEQRAWLNTNYGKAQMFVPVAAMEIVRRTTQHIVRLDTQTHEQLKAYAKEKRVNIGNVVTAILNEHEQGKNSRKTAEQQERGQS